MFELSVSDSLNLFPLACVTWKKKRGAKEGETKREITHGIVPRRRSVTARAAPPSLFRLSAMNRFRV